MKLELPEVAKNFLHAPQGAHAFRTVRVFHYWLLDHCLDLQEIERRHVDAFLKRPSRSQIGALTRNDYRYKIRRYINWLYAKGVISFDGTWLQTRHQLLPAHAEQFLESLTPTLKPTTCHQYRNSLRNFHNWLAREKLRLRGLKREHAVQWFQHLANERGQAPATRVNIIVAVRV